MPAKTTNSADAWLSRIRISGQQTQQFTTNRLRRLRFIVYITIGVATTVIILVLANLQIRQHGRYAELANGNRLRERVIYAPRGRILDRNGRVLAETVLTTQLVVFPYLLNTNSVQTQQQISAVAKILHQSASGIKAELQQLPSDDIQAHVLASRISQPDIIALEELLPNNSAFEIQDIPSRHYNASAALGTILGYTGLVTPQNLADDTTGRLLPTDTVGREGVEASYDQILRGVDGREKIEVDSLGRPVSIIARQTPQPGHDVRLTIDLDIQKRLATAMQRQMIRSHTKRAAGVIIDPNNGDVLAMVSLPNYDDNDFVGGISTKEYTALNLDTRQPLVNKVITDGYPTGSIIKPLVASAALQEHVVTPETTIVDHGYLDLHSIYDPSVTYRYFGWYKPGLGPMQVRSAIAFSSNIYFYTVGGGYGNQPGLGVDRLTKYYRAFGLGKLTDIALPHEFVGRVPDPTWKKRTTGQAWFQGDTYNISIGQGDMLVTPLQITLAECAVANGGKLWQPRISFSDPERSHTIPVNPSYLEIVREGMRQTVVNGTTNPAVFANVGVPVGAKSGTAETDSPGGRPPHSWYVAFAPYDHPKMLATVLIEEGREGVAYSAPAIAETFSGIFPRQR